MSAERVTGRLLAIDFGTKRIGFALSDELGWSASPLEVWHRVSIEADLAHVRSLIEANDVRELVVGLPYRMDGSEGTSLARAKVFVDALRAEVPELPLHTPDETLTTFEAEERMRSLGLSPAEAKQKVDAFAALVILEEFLRSRGVWVEPEEAEGHSKSSGRVRRGRRH